MYIVHIYTVVLLLSPHERKNITKLEPFENYIFSNFLIHLYPVVKKNEIAQNWFFCFCHVDDFQKCKWKKIPEKNN